MEEKQNEQILENAKAVEKEVSADAEKTEISFGKFKDVNALLNAYNSLEAEFTKRCQRIKELEGKTEKTDITVPVSMGENPVEANKGISEEDKEKILKDYLKGIVGGEKKVVFLDGSGTYTKTNAEKPKSLDEAGNLAKSIFNN